MSHDIVTGVLASALATSGTITVGYPTNRSKGNYQMTGGHKFVVGGNDVYTAPNDFTLTFNANASGITLTWKRSNTLASGRRWTLQLERQGPSDGRPFNPVTPDQLVTMSLVQLVDLGSPTALSATAICAAQAVGGAVNLTINGANASGGVATNDVPRALRAVSANAGDTTQTLTFRGKDVYGNSLTETITLNGTTVVSGKKAFKTVTQVAASAATAGNISVGTTDILGLPVFLPSSALILKEIQDGAAATAGTVVAADTATATATTGDVRGTYLPNAATDGSKGCKLLIALPDSNYKGEAQFAG